jgi:hypothetical protein
VNEQRSPVRGDLVEDVDVFACGADAAGEEVLHEALSERS